MTEDNREWNFLMFIMIVSAAVAVLRFDVPGHELSLAGSYEAFAHIWCGALLVWSFQKKWTALAALIVISLLELVMFLLR